MTEDNAAQQIRFFLDWAFSLGGAIAVVGFFLLLVWAAVAPSIKWVVLTLALYVCTFGYSTDRWFDNTLATPLQQLRDYSRPATVALLATLVLPTIMASRGWRNRLVAGGTVAYFVFEIVYSTRILLGGFFERGAGSILIYCLVFACLGIGLSRWLQTTRDVYTALMCVVAAAVLLLVGTCYQLVVNPSAILWFGRIYGTTNNPNTVASMLAIATPTACFLVSRPGVRAGFSQVFLIAAIGLFAIFLVWSGSRSGFLATSVALMMLFRRRMGTLLLIAMSAGIFATFAAVIFEGSTGNIGRLFSTLDNRSAVWRLMVVQTLENPLFGQIGQHVMQRENFYLAAASSTGLVGLLPLMVAFFLTGRTLLQLRPVRDQLGDERGLLDLIGAVFAALLISAVFTADLLGSLVYPVFTFYIFLAILTYLRDRASLAYAPAAVVEDPEPYVGWEPEHA